MLGAAFSLRGWLAPPLAGEGWAEGACRSRGPLEKTGNKSCALKMTLGSWRRPRTPSLTLPRKRERGPPWPLGASICGRPAIEEENGRQLSTSQVLARVALTALVLASAAWPAAAEDTVKVALGQRGDWETAASELGQSAGIFRKRGLTLELVHTNDSAETLQAVASGSVDVGIGLGTAAVMAAYTKGSPLRVIGNAGSGSSEYWYVQADSPIKTVADANGGSIAFSATGSSSHLVVLSLIKNNGLFARAVATGNPAATFTQVMSGQVDVGWASPPFGLDAVAEGKIRIIGRGNDVPEFRDQTIRLIVANAGFLERRKDVAARFVQAYRDTLEWMYSDPAALDAYAQFADTSPANARELRDVYFPRDHLSVDFIKGLDAAIIDGIAFRYIAQPLTKQRLDALFQIPPPIK
jgi:NitT/TauT family transport system substrate-binding protein